MLPLFIYPPRYFILCVKSLRGGKETGAGNKMENNQEKINDIHVVSN